MAISPEQSSGTIQPTQTSFEMNGDPYTLERSLKLLKELIATPSPSNEEQLTAEIWENALKESGVENVRRFHNNIWAINTHFKKGLPILMLNSHHDTVKPSASYSRDPYKPDIENGRLYGLGSNDAGASGVVLAETFIAFKDKTDLPFNIILAITASEEKMGEFGMRAFLPYLKENGFQPDMAIVGEPTGMKAAIGERGLVVLDGITKGKSGHAARNEGINALYRAIEDIESLKNFNPGIESEILGPISINVTMINSGTQHNVVPDVCTYVVDIRTTDVLTNEETVELLQKKVKWSSLTPRSTRIRASAISETHPLVEAVTHLGIQSFISPTTSDMALMYEIPSLKIGPGKSERSHSADEYVCISEIEEALKLYPRILQSLADRLMKQ